MNLWDWLCLHLLYQQGYAQLVATCGTLQHNLSDHVWLQVGSSKQLHPNSAPTHHKHLPTSCLRTYLHWLYWAAQKCSKAPGSQLSNKTGSYRGWSKNSGKMFRNHLEGCWTSKVLKRFQENLGLHSSQQQLQHTLMLDFSHSCLIPHSLSWNHFPNKWLLQEFLF